MPIVAACDKDESASAATEMSEPEVTVVTIKPEARAVIRRLPGRIAAMPVAEVRPRVSGIVVERLLHQGSEVKAGDPLYRIDPKPFEIEVLSNEAALAKAEAKLRQALRQAQRMSYLAKKQHCIRGGE